VILLDSTYLASVSLPQRQRSQSVATQETASLPFAPLAIPEGGWSLGANQYLSANVSTRGEIVSYILANPGVYLREISEDLGLSMGVVQYHIWALTRNGEIEDYRSGRYRRFFGASRYDGQERIVISLIRQGTAGRIITVLSGNESLTHAKLAARLGVTSQALSWQMKRLKEMGIVETLATQGREANGYRLADGISQMVESVAENPNIFGSKNPGRP